MLFKRDSQWGGSNETKVKDIFINIDPKNVATTNQDSKIKTAKKASLKKSKPNKNITEINDSITSVASNVSKKNKKLKKKQKPDYNTHVDNQSQRRTDVTPLNSKGDNQTSLKKKKRKKNKLTSFDSPNESQTNRSDNNQNISAKTLPLKRKYEDLDTSKQSKRKKNNQGKVSSQPQTSKLKTKQNKNSKFNKNLLVKVLNKAEDTTPKVLRAPSHLPPNLQELYESSLRKLEVGKFRYLNEDLATSVEENKQNFDFHTFQEYHKGFSEQAAKWEVNPIDKIIKILNSRSGNQVIADFGCGDAKIAHRFPKRTVHSFDLHALNDKVTACNMVDVPLTKKSVDIAVYCLALMPTIVTDHILEACRVLKTGGLLIIAELTSRLEKQNFVTKMKKYGFQLEKKEAISKIFTLLRFTKTQGKTPPKEALPDLTLLPFMYKKR